jgi:hypothetical protein
MADIATGVGLPHTTHATRARATGIHRIYLVGPRRLVSSIGHSPLHPIFLIPDFGPCKAMLVLLSPPCWMPAQCFASAHPVPTQRCEGSGIESRSASPLASLCSKIGHPANTKSPTWPMSGIQFGITLRFEDTWTPRTMPCRPDRESKPVGRSGGGKKPPLPMLADQARMLHGTSRRDKIAVCNVAGGWLSYLRGVRAYCRTQPETGGYGSCFCRLRCYWLPVALQ